MKKLSLIFAAICLCSGLAFAEKGKDNNEDDILRGPKAYDFLRIKELAGVNSYFGYEVNVTFVHPDPVIEISFISAKGRTPTNSGSVTIKSLLTLVPHFDPGELDSIQSRASAVKNDKPFTASLVDSKNDDKSPFVAFDLFGNDGKKVMTDWLNRESGFRIKSISFGLDGKPLSVLYYAKLSINPKQIPPPPSFKPQVVKTIPGLGRKDAKYFMSGDFNDFIEDFITSTFHL